MNTFHRVTLLLGLFVIASCGGGGGGGGGTDYGQGSGGSGSTNTAPTITNSVFNISVMENQVSAFTISATDPENDTLSYSLSGTDGSLFGVSSSGVVTFNSAPDYENPSDSNTDNVYVLTATVSDGSLTDSEDFNVTVTNDTSDDITSVSFDGTLVAMGPVQGATVCIEVTAGTCAEAQYTSTSAQDGTFSITADSGVTGVIRSSGGFDPITNRQFEDAADSLSIGQPVTEQNFVISPLSTMLNEYNGNVEYETLKSKLGIDSSFMIRFDNPYSNLDSAIYSKAAVVNTQLIILYDVVKKVHPNFENNSAMYELTEDILNRTGSETSLGDTSFIKDFFTNLDSGFSPSSQQLVDLSSGTSAFLQKIYADSSNSLAYFANVGAVELATLMNTVMMGSASSEELDKLTFNTIGWINENTAWSGGTITDVESDLNVTSYSLSNNGTSNYIVDNVNPSSTEFIIYVKEGDVIQFEATSSVTSSHPFKLSTQANATSTDSGEIGTSEGWDQANLTLTVGANTPDTIYPYCDFHSGMYSSGRIVKVGSFTQSNIDLTSASGAMQVKGTVATGPFKGASGYTYKVYLSSQGDSDHAHTFHEYPGLTFYMPDTGGYHGSETASSDTVFKAKSHYVTSSSDDGNDGGGGY